MSVPLLLQIVDRLDEPVKAIDVEKDIQAVITAKGTGENIPEQMLPDFYAEDLNNIMNRDRRKEVSDRGISKGRLLRASGLSKSSQSTYFQRNLFLSFRHSFSPFPLFSSRKLP